MISVNVKQLLAAIEDAEVFKIPEMNEGTTYLYENLYQRLANDEEVYMSELNFDSFELEDLGLIQDLDRDFDTNLTKTKGLIKNIHEISPICCKSLYV